MQTHVHINVHIYIYHEHRRINILYSVEGEAFSSSWPHAYVFELGFKIPSWIVLFKTKTINTTPRSYCFVLYKALLLHRQPKMFPILRVAVMKRKKHL